MTRNCGVRCGNSIPSSPSAMLFLKETGLPWLEKPFTPEQVLALAARIETA